MIPVIALFCCLAAVTGEIAHLENFPYMVGFEFFVPESSHWCGGSLISNKFVLTAASCTSKAYAYDVHLGTFDRFLTDIYGIKFHVSQNLSITVHEKYNNLSGANDIALIQLPEEIEFSVFIQPVSLPQSNQDSFSLEWGIASGWGAKDKFQLNAGAGRYLRYIESTIMPNTKCDLYAKVTSSNICIAEYFYNEPTCFGDRGGPLVVIRNGKKVLVGVALYTFEMDCHNPSIFTRVSSFLNWIMEKSGVNSTQSNLEPDL